MRPSVVVLTGAGISADSGLATFRGAGGLWEGRRVEDVATPGAWRAAPELVWRFYQARRASLASVEPNAAHLALAEFEATLRRHDLSFLLVTQNVDDLHDRAGSKALHMHGELASLRCESCHLRVRDLNSVDPDTFVDCPSCGPIRLRPDIVWFGEMPFHLDKIERALMDCTHFLAVGTSGNVYPAAGFLQVAREAGATTYVNSLDKPENLSPFDRFRGGRAIDVLPHLLEELTNEFGLGTR